MAFKVKRSPNDKKLFYDKDFDGMKANIVTFGRGSVLRGCDITTYDGRLSHLLGGRFSSLAQEMFLLCGGQHNYKNVTTSPLDVSSVLKKIFGEVRSDLHALPFSLRRNHHQVIVGNDVWIGRNVTILGGVKVGNGAVIGTGAVVTKNIPPYAIAVGNPAQVIKYRFDEETIKKLLAVKWWNWDLEKIADNLPIMHDVEKFLDTHYSPELEEFPEDEFTQKLDKFVEAGHYIYQFVSDFGVESPNFILNWRAHSPLWHRIVRDFRKAKLKDAVLVVWAGKDATKENLQALTEAIGNKKNILVFKHDKNFSPAALRKATHFITTRELTTLEALDYLWNTDVNIVSALDNNIFGR